MAKFPTTEARPELGFTPTTGVRARIDVRQGDVGGAVGQALIAGAGVLQERSARKEAIRVKNRANLDVQSAKQARNRRDLMKAEIATMKTDTPPEKWEEETIKIVTKGNSDIVGLDYSPEEAAKQQIISQGDLAVLPEQSFAAAASVISTAAIKTTEENLTALYREGDTGEIAAGVIDSTKTFKNNGVPAKAILLKLKAAREAGGKLKKQDTLDGWQDKIAVNPDATETILEAELELRKTGKETIPELDSADIQSLLNTATNRKSQLTADAQAELNAKNKALETQLHNDIVAGTASVTDIAKSSLPAEAQRRLERDLSDVPKRDLARTWAIQDSSEATEEKNRILTTIEAGQLDINEARSAVSMLIRIETLDGRSILTKATFDKTMTKITNGGRDFIDKFVAKKMEFIKGYLLPRSLTLAESELRLRQMTGKLTGTQRRQFASVGFLIQVAQHQVLLIEDSVDRRIRDAGIEDTSGNEAKAIVAEEWLLVKEKTLAQKMQEYTIASGQKLIMPFGFPQKTWEDANPRIRSVIIQAVSENMDNKAILDLLNL